MKDSAQTCRDPGVAETAASPAAADGFVDAGEAAFVLLARAFRALAARSRLTQKALDDMERTLHESLPIIIADDLATVRMRAILAGLERVGAVIRAAREDAGS